METDSTDTVSAPGLDWWPGGKMDWMKTFDMLETL